MKPFVFTFLAPILLLVIWGDNQNVCSAETKYPVVLVPGDGGSQLEVKLNKTSAPHYYCDLHTSKYESLWLNLEELLPGVLDCFVDNMRLHYDKDKHITYNTPGVDIRTKDFGSTSSLEWLDPSPVTHVSLSLAYFYPIVNELVTKKGYVRDKSVRGAPFDFRKAPNELEDYFKNFKALVEETYLMNNKTKVVIIGHSMGNPVTLFFLNHQSPAWKSQYIQSFISLAGVWGGAVKPLRLFSSGDGLDVVIVNPLSVRPEQRSMPSTAFLMPSDLFWNASEVLVKTEHKNYTVANYKEFFSDLNCSDCYNMRLDTKDLIRSLTPPGVPVHCVHGSKVDTPASLEFAPGGFPDKYPKTIMGDGDGTVNMRSLLGCLRWINEQKYPVHHKVVEGAEHMGVLSNAQVIQYVLDVVTNKS